MFAVVKYNDYRKEQSFEIITCTEDFEYAKKMAFNMCRCSFDKNAIQKITTQEKNHFLHPINKTIVSYRVIDIADNSISAIYSTVYAVLEISNPSANSVLDEVDESLFWTDTKADADY